MTALAFVRKTFALLDIASKVVKFFIIFHSFLPYNVTL
jgi:hypothetical protein